jgi:hypothetical protein
VNLHKRSSRVKERRRKYSARQGNLADGLGGLKAVHVGHLAVHEDQVVGRVALDRVDALQTIIHHLRSQENFKRKKKRRRRVNTNGRNTLTQER